MNSFIPQGHHWARHHVGNREKTHLNERRRWRGPSHVLRDPPRENDVFFERFHSWLVLTLKIKSLTLKTANFEWNLIFQPRKMAGSLLIYSRVMWFTIKSNDFPSSKFAKQYLMVDHQNHQNVDCKSVSKPLCSTSPTSYIHTQYMHIIYCYCKCWGTPPVILMIAINKLQLLTYIFIYLFIYLCGVFVSLL